MKKNIKRILTLCCAFILLLNSLGLNVLFGTSNVKEVQAAYSTSTDLIDVDFGKDENYEWGTLEQGATKYHSGLVPLWDAYQGTYGELPSYLVGHKILRTTSFPMMTITAKEDCYVYVLAIECKPRAEEAGFKAVATYEAGTVYSMEVTLMEKKLTAGSSVVFGNSNDNLFATKEQLDYPKLQLTSQDLITVDWGGKDVNPQWGTLEQGATKYHSGLVAGWPADYAGEYGELPSYLEGHKILRVANFQPMTITAKEDCYVYILAAECKAVAEAAGFKSVATYAAGTVYKMEVTLMEKKLTEGESITSAGNNDNLFATKEQLAYPQQQPTSQDFIAIDFGKDENHEWGPLAQGATKYHSGLVPLWEGYQGTYGELPSYLVGHQILKLTSFPYMTITAKEDCYVYVLAIECKPEAEKSGFEAVATYEAGTVYKTEVTLMEKKLTAGSSVVFGNSNDNLFATKEQLAYPQQQPTSQDFIAIDFGKDENYEWGTLEQGATKYHSGLVPQWEGYQGTYGELPSYLVGHKILRMTSFPMMTITAKEDCYVYILAAECKPIAEEAGFEAVARYAEGTVYPIEVTLMEKKLTAGESFSCNPTNDNLFATVNQLEVPQEDKLVLCTTDIITLLWDGYRNHTWDILNEGTWSTSTKFPSGEEFTNLPNYLVGHKILQPVDTDPIQVIAKEECYVYVLAQYSSISSFNKLGFQRVAAYKAGKIYNGELYLLEKEVIKGETFEYADLVNIFATKSKLDVPAKDNEDPQYEGLLVEGLIGHDNGYFPYKIAQFDLGANILHPDLPGLEGTIIQKRPSYLKGLYFVQSSGWNGFQCVTKQECYIYILANKDLVPELKEKGFKQVAEYGAYEISSQWGAEGLILMERKFEKTERFSFGEDKYGMLMTSAKKLVIEDVMENYTDCEGDYYCAENGTMYRFYKDQTLVFIGENETIKGTYYIADTYSLRVKIGGKQQTFDFKYRMFDDAEGNTYKKLGSYKLSFVTGNGSEIDTQILDATNDYMPICPTEPTYEGRKFLGWATADGTEYKFDKMQTESITLYAKWDGDVDYEVMKVVEEKEGFAHWPFLIGSTTLFVGAILSAFIILTKSGKKTK